MQTPHQQLDALLTELDPKKSLVFLTGAGVSAESGIPTFRGKGGYWTVGSKVYQPQQMATWLNFEKQPREVWRWYLYRRGVCRAGAPNAAHRALVELERARPAVFHLITQNIDGLHRIAGNSADRTYEIHGTGEEMRCAERCTDARYPIPEGVKDKAQDDPLPDAEYALLCCPRCGGLARPHVLWFDEYYEEELYRSNTAMIAAHTASVMVVAGTSGATSLPVQAVTVALKAGAVLIDINPNPNPFRELADQYYRGLSLRGSATEWMPEVVQRLKG